MTPTTILSTSALAKRIRFDCSPSALATLDEGVLEALARHIRGRVDFSPQRRSTWDDPLYWNSAESPAARSQYYAVGNAINFRFWRMQRSELEPAQGVVDGERLSGSMYLWRRLRRCTLQGTRPVLDASFLANLTPKDFDAVFSDDTGVNPLSVAAQDRIANLRDLGRQLLDRWSGNFYNVVVSANGSLARFIKLAGTFRAFDDPCHKLTMVNTIMHLGSGIAEFDAEPLPGIDYHLLKQLLRHGALRPIEALRRKISTREFLDAAEGQELRRAALCAFIRLSELTGISGEILDNRWWWNRAKCKNKNPVCHNPDTARECPFFGPCEMRTDLAFPLEETRYY